MTILGQCGPLNHAIVPVAALILSIAIEGVVGNKTLFHKSRFLWFFKFGRFLKGEEFGKLLTYSIDFSLDFSLLRS